MVAIFNTEVDGVLLEKQLFSTLLDLSWCDCMCFAWSCCASGYAGDGHCGRWYVLTSAAPVFL